MSSQARVRPSWKKNTRRFRNKAAKRLNKTLACIVKSMERIMRQQEEYDKHAQNPLSSVTQQF